jgi:hypothetical protein
MNSSALWFTRSEGEQILQRLHASVTAWQMYALPLGRQAPDGTATLYDVEDLALVRLAGRMRLYLPPVVVGVLLAQLRDELRAALRSRAQSVLVVNGRPRMTLRRGETRPRVRRGAPWGEVVKATDAPAAVLSFPLHDLLDGIEREGRALRRAQPDVWVGHRRLEARAVGSSLATEVLSLR